MTKKPTTKKPKPPTLKDLATQLKANRRRMDEMSSDIVHLYKGTADLDERTDCQSRDIGTLIKRANGVDQILSANAASHRSEVSRLSNAVLSLEGGQLQHAHMISALEKAATAPDDPKGRHQTDRPDTEAEKAAITRVIQALEILRSVL